MEGLHKMRPWQSIENIEVIFDETFNHRLKITCKWDENLPQCLYIMLNPSTADMKQCDPTLDKCIKIASNNGFGSLAVVNLFSLRTHDPNVLLESKLKTLPENFENVKLAIDDADTIIAAWGEKGTWFNATYPVLKYLEDNSRDIYYLEMSKYGIPKHPLFLKNDTIIKDYTYREGRNFVSS